MRGDPEQLDRADREHRIDESSSSAVIEATIAGCGPGRFTSALELGGAIGEFTELLAPRCERLTQIDVAVTAAAMARRRLAGLPHVEVVRGAIPDAIPERGYDLVVAAEILHFLAADALNRTLAVIRARLVPGGRLVVVHWRPEDSERPLTAATLHTRLREGSWLQSLHVEQGPDLLLDVLERR